MQIPQHTHEGNESFLVLRSYSDEYGDYKGSVQVSDDHNHTPVGDSKTVVSDLPTLTVKLNSPVNLVNY